MNTLIVEVCVGPQCHQCGADDLFDAVEALPPEKRELIDLRAVVFFTGGPKGPNVLVNGTLLSGVTPKRLLRAIDDIFAYGITEMA